MHGTQNNSTNTFFILLCIEARHTLSLQREKEGKRHGKEPEPIRTS